MVRSGLSQRLMHNSLIFGVGMLCAFVLFSIITSSGPVTANIGDALQSSSSRADLAVRREGEIRGLYVLHKFPSGPQSLRIDMLYPPHLQTQLQHTLLSDVKVSTSFDTSKATIIIDLSTQSLSPDKALLELHLPSQADTKDIPVIESVTLYDGETTQPLQLSQPGSSDGFH